MTKILIIGLICFSNGLFAQYNYGVIGGSNLSTIKAKNNVDIKSAMSYYLGFANQFYLNEDLGFELDVVYSRKGFQSPYARLDGNYRRFINHYIDLQLFTKTPILKNIDFIGGFACGFYIGETVRPIDPLRDVSIGHFDVYFIGGFSQSLGEKIDLHLKYNHTITENHKNRVLQLGLLILLKK